MMGMQTMQAQQPMQGGGKAAGGMMPQQGGYSQQPRPMDMGIPRQQYIGNNDVQRAANDMLGMPQQQGMGQGGRGDLPADFYASSGSPNFGSTPNQQSVGQLMQGMGMGQGMGQQARFGQPNRYSNTTQQQPWDNASINPQPSGKSMQSQQPMQGGGKSAGGKGAGMQQGGQMQGGGKGQAVGGYPTAATNFGQPTQTAAYPTAVTNYGTPNLLTSSLANTANTANTTNTANTGLQNDQTYNELDYRNMGS